MTHSDFSIGHEFISGGKRWRCTDVGTRTIAAVCLSDHPDDESWYNGPPYAVVERVFDEYDIEGCATVDSELETASDELSDVISLRHRDGSMFLLTNARVEHRGGSPRMDPPGTTRRIEMRTSFRYTKTTSMNRVRSGAEPPSRSRPWARAPKNWWTISTTCSVTR